MRGIKKSEYSATVRADLIVNYPSFFVISFLPVVRLVILVKRVFDALFVNLF